MTKGSHMTDFRKVAGGSLAAPVRGMPPKTPEGYIRDEQDPYLFHLDVDPCEHRTIKRRYSGCCGQAELSYCARDNKIINRLVCTHCAS